MRGTHISDSLKMQAVADCFHTYAMEWSATGITWFVDEQSYHTFKNPDKSKAEWPFDNPFHLILNVAVGGSWGGYKGVDTEIWPQRMAVDYVRVYKKRGQNMKKDLS